MPSPDASRENGQRGGRPRGPAGRSKKTLARLRGEQRALQQLDITAERTMLEIARLAFADRRGVWTEDGRLKPLSEWTADEAACLEGLEVVIKNAEAGDGHTDVVHKVRLAKKIDALTVLAKHFNLMTERVNVTHTLKLEDLVAGSFAPAPDVTKSA